MMKKLMRPTHKTHLGLLLAVLLTFAATGAWAADPYVQSNTISVGSGPTDVVVNPTGTTAYVTNYTSGTVSEIDLATGVVTTINVGTNPTSIAIDPTGTFAYVTNYDNPGTGTDVTRILLSDRSTTTISGFNGPRFVVFASTGNRAYVSNQTGSTVSVINTATNTLIPGELITVGSGPQDMAISANGTKLYVSRTNAGAVAVVDLTTKTSPGVTTPITGLSDPHGLALYSSESKLAVAAQTDNAIKFYSTSSLALLSTLTGFSSPQAVTLSPSGDQLYVANKSANNVLIVDVTQATPVVIAPTLAVGNSPFQVRFVPNGSKVLTANLGSSSVSIISYYQDRTLSFATTSYVVPNGSSQTVTATPSGGSGTGTISYSAGSSTACSVVAGTGVVTMTATTGTCEISATITAGALNVSNTWAAASTTTSVTITTPSALEITATNLSVASGATITPTYAITSGALVSPNAISGMTYTYAGTGSTVYAASTAAPTAPGTYSVTPSAAVFSNGSASNYNTTYVAGTLTIEPSPSGDLPYTGLNIQVLISGGASLLLLGLGLVVLRRLRRA